MKNLKFTYTLEPKKGCAQYQELFAELHKKGELYKKIRHGKKIAKKMVEINQVPEDVKYIICKIAEKTRYKLRIH